MPSQMYKRVTKKESKMSQQMTTPIEEGDASPIHGDILEAVLSFVPLIDLISLCRVSKPWRRAVFSSLTNLNKVKPWLLIHTQTNNSFKSSPIHAYDPRSNAWVKINQPPTTNHNSMVRSSDSNLLYTLSCSNLSFSDDPFLQSWRAIKGPSVWRMDPVVALCGPHIVVAGSGWYFEDDPLAVEVYDQDSSTWRTSQPMPEQFKDTSSATWHSVASNQDQVIITETSSGTTFSFTPKSDTWMGPYNLNPHPRVFFSAVGFAGEILMVASLIGDPGRPEGLWISEVELETKAIGRRIGEAPDWILGKLKGKKGGGIRKIEVCAAEDFVYLYNSEEAEELVFCELGGEECVWGSVRNSVWNDDVKMGGRMVCGCRRVEIGDLQVAMRTVKMMTC